MLWFMSLVISTLNVGTNNWRQGDYGRVITDSDKDKSHEVYNQPALMGADFIFEEGLNDLTELYQSLSAQHARQHQDTVLSPAT